MIVHTLRTALAAACLAALSSAALAQGNGGGGGGGGGDSGSGLSPYAALNGNDRSAGVNNGNYRDPRLDPYLGAYGDGYGRTRPIGGDDRRVRRPYYGSPY